MKDLFCPCCQIGIDYKQMKNRHCNNCGHDFEIWHYYPNNDEIKHILSYNCPCDPVVNTDGTNFIIEHNSLDGREGVEWANEILENQ